MRRSKVQHLVVLGSFGLIVAACGTDDTQPADEFGEPTTPATTPAPAVEGAAAPTAGQPVTVPVVALAGSGFAGDVRLEPAAGGTQVTVTLHGESAGVHQGHIHTGTCEQPGGVVAPLEAVTLGDDGHGEATSSIDLALASLRDGRHIVVYHEADASPGAPVACAEIPAS